MFSTSSRYANSATYQALTPDGSSVTAVAIDARAPLAPIGFHPRASGERLDLIAVRYLNDPTGFWRLCDASDAIVAGALEARALIGVPAQS